MIIYQLTVTFLLDKTVLFHRKTQNTVGMTPNLKFKIPLFLKTDLITKVIKAYNKIKEYNMYSKIVKKFLKTPLER